MKTNEPTNEELHKEEDVLFFKQGLSYLITGVNRCFSQMQKCEPLTKEEISKGLNLVEQINQKVAFFSSSHLASSYRDQGKIAEIAECDQDCCNHILSRKGGLNEEKTSSRLNLITRRAWRLMKGNLKLKKIIRRLKFSLKTKKKELSQHSEIEKIKQKLDLEESTKPLILDLKQKIVSKSKELSILRKSIEQKYQVGVELILSKITENQQKATKNKNHSALTDYAGYASEISCLVKKICDKSTQVPIRFKQADELDMDVPPLKSFQAQIDTLHQNYQKTKNLNKNLAKIQKMELKIDEINSHQEEGIVGDDWTIIALKSPKSYVVGTMKKGLKLIENHKIVYSGTLPEEVTFLKDMIYIREMDCYFLNLNEKLYRKNVDNKAPYLYMDIVCGNGPGACFRYSNLHQKLIINKDGENVAAINLTKKKVEIVVEKSLSDEMCDFRLFGEQENRMVAITESCAIHLYQFDYLKKIGDLVSRYKIALMSERHEMGISISVSDKADYMFVEVGQSNSPYFCSRMIILKVYGNSLVMQASIDQFSQKLGYKLALECCGRIGDLILWLGLSADSDAVAQVFYYNQRNGEFKEIEGKRVVHREFDPVKLHRIGSDFYYTGHDGRVLRLGISF